MNEELARYFFEEASRAFDFLVKQHSFAAPYLEVDDAIHFAYVTFMGRNLAIECSLDGREGDVACVVAQIKDGKKTTYRHTSDDGLDDRGVRVRENLFFMLRRRGVSGRLLSDISGLDARERIRVTLGDFASMLLKHGRPVLDDSPAALGSSG
jgi:hypothetical protein